jgi:hypothetical protein
MPKRLEGPFHSNPIDKAKMTQVTYYPGCSLSSTGKEYAESVEVMCKLLGVELVELTGWTCCGATSAGVMLGHEGATALPALTLKMAAEFERLDDRLHRGRLLGIIVSIHVRGAQQQAAIVGRQLQARQRPRYLLAQGVQADHVAQQVHGIDNLQA